MEKFIIDPVIKILKEEMSKWKTPIVTEISKERDPFKVLISCLLSLRTKDETTAEASERLFKIGYTPSKLLKTNKEKIEKAIYPVGFYKRKTETIQHICEKLIRDYSGKVPEEIDELLKFKGIGRKTANLVVTLGYGKPGICVDTHVHRISNRFGYVKSGTPGETEQKLREILPRKYWIDYNDLLVSFGQNLCRPISPFCSKCRIFEYCGRVGVDVSR